MTLRSWLPVRVSRSSRLLPDPDPTGVVACSAVPRNPERGARPAGGRGTPAKTPSRQASSTRVARSRPRDRPVAPPSRSLGRPITVRSTGANARPAACPTSSSTSPSPSRSPPSVPEPGFKVPFAGPPTAHSPSVVHCCSAARRRQYSLTAGDTSIPRALSFV
jgi:hypothetical protein